MKYNVELTPEAQNDYNNLGKELQNILDNDYRIIETQGIEYVFVKAVEHSIFEIKTKNIRSLFQYKEGQIIIVGLIFKKDTPKTPNHIKKIAKKRFSHHIE